MAKGAPTLKWITLRLRDWWRGYSDADLESYRAKMAAAPKIPGAIVRVTKAELRAMMENE